MSSEEITGGFAQLAAGRVDEAVAAFERALEHGQDVAALRGLARARLAQRRFDLAGGVLDRLLALQPTDAEARSHRALIDALGGDETALERLSALAAAPNAGFYERLNLGLVLAARGDFAAAERALEGAVEVEPRSFHALVEWAQLALRQDAPDRAIPRLERAAALAPDRSLPLAVLARAHLAQGHRGKAIAALAAALQRAPSERALYEQLVRVCLDAGAPKQAAAAAAELRRLDPKTPRYALLHGEALLALGKAEEARALFQAALDLGADAVDAKLGIARAHRLGRDEEQARLVLEPLVREHPTEPGAAAELARLYLDHGDGHRAAETLRRAVEAHGDDADLNLLMARALSATDRSAAIAHARKAISVGGPDVRDRAEALLRTL